MVANYLVRRVPRKVLDLILFHESFYVQFCGSSCFQRADLCKEVKVYLEKSFDRLVEVSSVVFQVACNYAVGEVLRQLTDFVPRFRRRNGSGKKGWVRQIRPGCVLSTLLDEFLYCCQ